MSGSNSNRDNSSRLLDEEKSDFGSISSQKSNNGKETSNMTKHSSFYIKWIRPLIAEFFGTTIFAFLHSTTAYTVGKVSPVEGNPLLPAITDGFLVAALVTAFGHISGTHVNFAITVAVAIANKIDFLLVPLYLVAQLLGSIVGAALSFVAVGSANGAFALGPGINSGQGVTIEIVLTTLLTLVVLVASVEMDLKNAGIAIGFAITVGILAGSRVSGGCMNPTLSIGPAIMSGKWNNYWIYWIGPLTGAVISGGLFRIFLSDHSRLLFPSTSS